MLNEQALIKMKETDVCKVSKTELVDIKNVVIDESLEKSERLTDYMRQIRNPYCLLCNGIVVKLNFSESEDTLGKKLDSYFLSL